MTNAYANQQREREKLRLANVGNRVSVRSNDNSGGGLEFQSTLDCSTDQGGGKRRDAVTPNSAEKETTWAVPRFLGITPRVPIAVVVALTGDHSGLVMLAFFTVRFCSGNDRSDIFCWRCFFHDR